MALMDRWPVDVLEAGRKAISLPWWLAQYQQRPGRGEGVAWGIADCPNVTATKHF